MDTSFSDLAAQMRGCSLCQDLPLGPRPLFQLDPRARILIAGQAPGRITHGKGIPFDDPSGDRLRDWLGVDRATFYDDPRVGIMPMGFCFPGTGNSGDLPPRPICADTWRQRMLDHLAQIQLTIVIGRYAIDWHMPAYRKAPITKVAQAWADHWPQIIALPHPSPRNNLWLRRNPWFQADVLPRLQDRVRDVLG